MEKHVTILGTAYIAFSALGIIGAIVGFVFMVGMGLLSGGVEGIAVLFFLGTAFFLLLVSAPGIIGGIGLLKRQWWARILVLILGFLNLINFPLGTILGIYTIWVLTQNEVKQLLAPASSFTSANAP